MEVGLRRVSRVAALAEGISLLDDLALLDDDRMLPKVREKEKLVLSCLYNDRVAGHIDRIGDAGYIVFDAIDH